LYLLVYCLFRGLPQVAFPGLFAAAAMLEPLGGDVLGLFCSRRETPGRYSFGFSPVMYKVCFCC
jgi:hypothetical protein